ncbi:helix-turn-helix domain-containing protein [Gordonia paraffinivorans]|uniref:helix-turn-helix domain-containing protein n=1 Tax=Gordonia paraffinivorans TaxID=175628 RepID=UPI001E508F5A|nr:helix-turn-helix domain-containing protein [Gordonia paraffinivorans]MCD2143958.1 helix-turn-helix domain-containing protein [Gordonia paraffinivorans]
MSASTVDDLRAFTVAEVAERLGVSKRSVQRLIAEGRLATLYPRRPGVPVRIPAPSLRSLLESGHTDGPGGAK